MSLLRGRTPYNNARRVSASAHLKVAETSVSPLGFFLGILHAIRKNFINVEFFGGYRRSLTPKIPGFRNFCYWLKRFFGRDAVDIAGCRRTRVPFSPLGRSSSLRYSNSTLTSKPAFLGETVVLVAMAVSDGSRRTGRNACYLEWRRSKASSRPRASSHVEVVEPSVATIVRTGLGSRACPPCCLRLLPIPC